MNEDETRDESKLTGPDRQKTPSCPICGKPRDAQFRPFCSKRCADIDLGRWLNGSYAIPVVEDDDEDGETAPANDPSTERESS